MHRRVSGKAFRQKSPKLPTCRSRYSSTLHIHKDHIGGSAAFKNIKGLQVVALESVADFLKEMNDPDRLLPNVTFKSTKTIALGGKTVGTESPLLPFP